MVRKFAAALIITLSLGVTTTGIAAADTPGMTHNSVTADAPATDAPGMTYDSIPFMTYN